MASVVMHNKAHRDVGGKKRERECVCKWGVGCVCRRVEEVIFANQIEFNKME